MENQMEYLIGPRQAGKTHDLLTMYDFTTFIASDEHAAMRAKRAWRELNPDTEEEPHFLSGYEALKGAAPLAYTVIDDVDLVLRRLFGNVQAVAGTGRPIHLASALLPGAEH